MFLEVNRIPGGGIGWGFIQGRVINSNNLSYGRNSGYRIGKKFIEVAGRRLRNHFSSHAAALRHSIGQER
jgi:hypothetical protein